MSFDKLEEVLITDLKVGDIFMGGGSEEKAWWLDNNKTWSSNLSKDFYIIRKINAKSIQVQDIIIFPMGIYDIDELEKGNLSVLNGNRARLEKQKWSSYKEDDFIKVWKLKEEFKQEFFDILQEKNITTIDLCGIFDE